MTTMFIFFLYYYCISNSLLMGILCKRYYRLLRLLRSLDVEENPRPRASSRSCCVVYPNDCLLLPEVEMCFCRESLFSSTLPGVTFSSHIRSMSLLIYMGVRLIDFEGWLYLCVITFRHIDSAVMSVDIVKS